MAHEQITTQTYNSEFSLEAQITRLKLSRYIIHRPSSLEKTLVLGKKEERRVSSSKVDEIHHSSLWVHHWKTERFWLVTDHHEKKSRWSHIINSKQLAQSHLLVRWAVK